MREGGGESDNVVPQNFKPKEEMKEGEREREKEERVRRRESEKRSEVEVFRARARRKRQKLKLLFFFPSVSGCFLSLFRGAVSRALGFGFEKRERE